MSIDQNLNAPAPQPTTASAIENELPAYRAVAPGAVVALILGVASVFCFASWNFLPVAALAVVVGVLADRKIQRVPDILTGRGLAQAGVGLGLIFGLTAVTIDTVQSVLRRNDATAFARSFEQVLAKESFDRGVWWSQVPSIRVNFEPEKLVADMTKSPQNAQMFEQKHAALRQIKQQLATKGASLHFEKLEASGVDGLSPYAAALYEVHTPEAANPKDREKYALVLFKGVKNTKGVQEWWIESIQFPAQPGTFQPPAKPVDDGHGHGH